MKSLKRSVYFIAFFFICFDSSAQTPGNPYTGCLSGTVVYTIGAYQNVPGVGGNTWVYRIGIDNTCPVNASIYSGVVSNLGSVCYFNPSSIASPNYQTGTLVTYQVYNCNIDEELPFFMGSILLLGYAFFRIRRGPGKD